MSDILEGRVCAVCRSVLDRRTPVDDPHAEGTWHHTFSFISEFGEPDHEPQPVPMGEFTNINAVCDFCSTHEVAYTYRFIEVGYEVTDDDGNTVARGEMSQDWATCYGCARLLDSRNINGLIARVIAAFKRKHGFTPSPQFADNLDRLYRRMIREGFQRAEVTPDDPFGQKGLK